MPEDEKKSSGGGLQSMASNFLSFISGQKKDASAIDELVARTRDSIEQGDVEDSTSFADILKMINSYKNDIGEIAQKYVGDIDLSEVSPNALFYYLEYEDERKNPSWKRRVHRFCAGLDMKKVYELNDYCSLAQLCYADTVDLIREGLETHSAPHELVYAEIRSQPGKPANFLALRRDQPSNSQHLEVLIGVRGTKSIADALTDMLCDVDDYRGGKAHKFILESGKFLVEKHRDLLDKLLKESGKKKLKITLVGHSLGAGAASIAGIELNDDPRFDVEVIGFGCPALLSKELAEQNSFIQTVVNDSDVIPRTSAIAIVNLILNVKEFDWTKYMQRDVSQSVAEIQRVQPVIFNDMIVGKIREIVQPMLDDFISKSVKHERTARVPVELFPPYVRCLDTLDIQSRTHSHSSSVDAAFISTRTGAASLPTGYQTRSSLR